MGRSRIVENSRGGFVSGSISVRTLCSESEHALTPPAFGALAILFFAVVFSQPKKAPSDVPLKGKIADMDLPGTTLFVTSIVLLFVALEFGGTQYAWSSYRVILCFIFSGLCMAAFVILQWYLGEKYAHTSAERESH